MPGRPTILAVDDIAANLVALEAVLDRDFDLVFADSGAKAIAKLEEGADVDVILMDVQMPVMDGFQAAEKIKKLPGCEDLPIVFITAIHRDDGYAKRGYQAGGIDYFTKPFDPELLRLKLASYSSVRRKNALIKKLEEKLRETEGLLMAGRKLSAVLESLPVGVLIADIDGRICQTNEVVSRICKASEAIQNDQYGELLGWWTSSGQKLKAPQGPLARALRSSESSNNELLQIRCFDGSTKAILASASPLKGLRGETVGAVIVIKDLSEPMQSWMELEGRVTRLIAAGVEIEQAISPI